MGVCLSELRSVQAERFDANLHLVDAAHGGAFGSCKSILPAPNEAFNVRHTIVLNIILLLCRRWLAICELRFEGR